MDAASIVFLLLLHLSVGFVLQLASLASDYFGLVFVGDHFPQLPPGSLYIVLCSPPVWATCPALTSPKCFHQPQGFLQGLSAFLPTGFRRRSNENQLPLLLERAALDNGGKKKREKGKLEKCKNTRTLGSGIALMRNNCCLSEQQAGVSSR